jgi:DNA-binding HxlR family transcriptional regulator
MPRPDHTARSDCPISYALEIFGDRWTLIVLRDLLLMSRQRYGELLACEEGIATNVLADRLKRLETRGLIAKARDPADKRQFIYRPTEASVSLVPMLVEMTVWGMRNGARGGADTDFIQRFEEDRDALIGEIEERVRAAGGIEDKAMKGFSG